jgi:hypothetical protein
LHNYQFSYKHTAFSIYPPQRNPPELPQEALEENELAFDPELEKEATIDNLLCV